jgi:hypothetical protein
MSTLHNSGFDLLSSSGETLQAGLGLLEDPNVLLVVNDAEHAHTAANAELAQASSLTVSAAEHSHTAANVDLTQANTLTVAAATHAHSADGTLGLVQAHVLSVAGSSHSHSAESPELPAILIEFAAATGLALTAKLFQVNSDVIVGVTDAVVEQANVKGMYIATFTEELAGPHLIVGYDGGSAVSAFYVMLDSTTAIHRTGNYADVVSAAAARILCLIAKNKTVTDPVSGQMIVYEDDDVTPALVASLYENVAETQQYRSRGAEVRRRLA